MNAPYYTNPMQNPLAQAQQQTQGTSNAQAVLNKLGGTISQWGGGGAGVQGGSGQPAPLPAPTNGPASGGITPGPPTGAGGPATGSGGSGQSTGGPYPHPVPTGGPSAEQLGTLGLSELTQEETQNIHNLLQIQQVLQQAGITLPGMGQPINPDHVGDNPFVADYLSGFLRDTGLGFPAGAAGGSATGLRTAFSFNDMIQGAGRGVQREDLLQSIIQQAQGSGAYQAGSDLSAAASHAVDPNLLDDRFRALEEEARLQNASSLNSQRNYLQDLGLAGAGAGQAPALLGAERGSARDLQSTLNQLAAMKEQERMQNLQAATPAAAAGADIFRGLGVDPQLNMVSSLGAPQNIQSQQFQNALSEAAQLASGTALAGQGPSTLEKLAPILGGGLSAGGSILGGFLAGRNN